MKLHAADVHDGGFLDLMRRVAASIPPAAESRQGLPLGKAGGEIRVQPMPVSRTNSA